MNTNCSLGEQIFIEIFDLRNNLFSEYSGSKVKGAVFPSTNPFMRLKIIAARYLCEYYAESQVSTIGE